MIRFAKDWTNMMAHKLKDLLPGKTADFLEGNSAGMPSLNPARKDVYNYYRLAFLPDGYPGRVTDRGLVPHPLYGTYVINDYLSQHRSTKNTVFLDAAKKVADRALARMEPMGDALVFNYTPEMGLSSLPGTFYSGLTQARYMSTLARLWKASGDDRYIDAAHKTLNSLLIPIESGGVLRQSHGGAVIEEWPNIHMPDFTLNGWTTALDLVADFFDATGSEKAGRLLEQNLIALRALLPLYDVPEVANSRYRLSGKTWIKVSVKGTSADFVSGEINVPGIGIFPYLTDTESRWNNYLSISKAKPFRNRTFALNTNLNYITYPGMNSLHITLLSKGRGSAKVVIQSADYAPLRDGMTNYHWVDLGEFDLSPGENRINLDIPWDTVPLVAYPTTHTKKIGGKNYNSYHYIHINNLKKLADRTGDGVLADYSSRWEGYTRQWPHMPVYSNSDIEYASLNEAQAALREKNKG